MPCPVCGASAKTLKTPDGVSVRCTDCGDYDIAATVKDAGMLERVSPAERHFALQKAKRSAGKDQRPTIMSYML